MVTHNGLFEIGNTEINIRAMLVFIYIGHRLDIGLGSRPAPSERLIGLLTVCQVVSGGRQRQINCSR